MATAQPSQLEDRVSCTVCMEGFNNGSNVPKILPCEHTFCEACIVQSTKYKRQPSWNCTKYKRQPSLNCPNCRRRHVIPQGGFMTNRVVLDIVDELQKDVTVKSSSALKCTNHANKNIAYVCIDCLDTFCSICATSSIHMLAKHHVEEIDEAVPVLQQKFMASQRQSFENNLSLLEESSCSSTELEKAKVDIKSLANKIHAEATKWETEQLSMVREMQSVENAQEKKKRELNSLDIDLNTLLLKMKQNQPQRDVEDEFMNKLHRRQAEDQIRFDNSLQTLLNKLRAEIESLSSIQSKYLKKAASVTSTEHGSSHSVAKETKDKQKASTSNKVAKSKVPQGTRVLYKVRVVNPSAFAHCYRVSDGDVMAVTEEFAELVGGSLHGISERTGYQCNFPESWVERI